jgi:precorrin-2/cobalt-factor-2 C20-methyltransferase
MGGQKGGGVIQKEGKIKPVPRRRAEFVAGSRVYSIGLGPGDFELITVKAKRILESSDVVIVPESDPMGRSMTKDIVLHYVSHDKLLPYYIPMTRNKIELENIYQEIAEKIKALTLEDKIVSYVTLGDPSIYSTSIYLAERLTRIGVEIRHVPGVSSINAASAIVGIPLCRKTENIGVYEMPSDVETVIELINRHSTTVFMKVNKRLPALIEAVRCLMPERGYLARRIGLDDEAIYDLLNYNEPLPDTDYLSIALIRK